MLDPLIVEILLLLLVSVAIGILGSLLGIGGGIFLVPILTLAFNIEIQIAVATSLIAMIVTSSTSASNYLREGYTNVRLGMFLEAIASAGAVIGALIAIFLDPSAIEIILVVALVYAAIYMHWGKKLNSPSEDGPQSRFSSRFNGQYMDSAMGKEVKYSVKKIELGGIGCFLAGNLSGLIGIGGGIVKVPIMNLWMRVPMKAATATSNLMISVTAVAGGLVYLSNNLVAPILIAIVAIGTFFGASVGARAFPRIEAGRIRSAFSVILMIIAAIMLLRIIGLGVS